MLTLVVDAGEASGAVDRRGAYVTTGRPNVETPEADFNSAGRDGSLSQAPEIIFKDQTTPIEAIVEYPEGDTVEREIGIVLSSGTSEDVIGLKEHIFEQRYTSNTAWTGKVSTFKLLDNLGTSPNITYIGNQPAEEAEPIEPQEAGGVSYEGLPNQWGVEVVDNRLHHLEYGARANRSYGDDPHAEEGGE